MTITFPLLTVVDDSGAIVSGATVTVSSLTDKSGTAKSTSLATVNVAGPNVSVDYDAAGNGEAWITLSISAAGHTFTNSNATPSFYLPADSSRVLGSIPASSAGAGWTARLRSTPGWTQSGCTPKSVMKLTTGTPRAPVRRSRPRQSVDSG